MYQVLDWLHELMQGSGRLEEICAGDERSLLLDNLVSRESSLAVLFHRPGDDLEVEEVTSSLEEVDRRLRRRNVVDDDDDDGRRMLLLVRCGSEAAAEDYGVTSTRPGLVLFRRGVPARFSGELSDPDAVLSWIVRLSSATSGASVEVVTDARLERLVTNKRYVAVFFYDREWDEDDDEEEDEVEDAALSTMHGLKEELMKRTGVLLVKTADRYIPM